MKPDSLRLPYRFRWLLGAVMAFATVTSLPAQAPSGYTPDGDIQQAAFLPDAGMLAARLEASRAQQIRVTVQVLSIDAKTRAAIYHEIGHENIKTRGTRIPTASAAEVKGNEPSSVSAAQLDSSHQIGTTSHVSTCLLDETGTGKVLAKVRQSADCTVLRTPSFILLDGLRAGYSDISQRPFIVDAHKVERGVNPDIQVLEEGTRVQVHATLAKWDGQSSPKIQLQSEIHWHKIVDVAMEPVFGLEETATAVQVPTYAVKMATATEEMVSGQVLLVDPYLKEEIVVEEAQPSGSVLSRLTGVGRNPKPPITSPTQRYLVFLIQPSVPSNDQ